MIFKRRDKPPFWSRLREIMFPRKGFLRSIDYIRKRLHRLPDSPHRIALGFACGALASFTPFFGFHIVLAAALAWVIRANMLAAAFGTIVGNPLSFPFIAAASLELGWWLLGDRPMTPESGLSVAWLFDNIELIFLPYLIGGILPGLATAAISYWLIGPVVAAYQERRRTRLATRAAKWRAAILDEQGAYMARDGKEGDDA